MHTTCGSQSREKRPHPTNIGLFGTRGSSQSNYAKKINESLTNWKRKEKITFAGDTIL